MKSEQDSEVASQNDDKEKAIEILEQLPEEEKRIMMRQITESYAGPVMPPQYAEHYEHILPGSAERILKLAEQQAAHRMQMESKALDAQIRDSQEERDSARTDKRSAIGLIVFVVLLACIMAERGYEKLALALVGVLVGGVIIGHLVNAQRNNKS